MLLEMETWAQWVPTKPLDPALILDLLIGFASLTAIHLYLSNILFAPLLLCFQAVHLYAWLTGSRGLLLDRKPELTEKLWTGIS